MSSNTKNVHVGPCRVTYDGIDLGYTKGGVDVEVTSETFKTEVDQFGKTPISEIITARMVKASVPMAETDLDKLMLIMPGATLVTVGGAKASGSLTIATNPTDGKTVVINNKVWTFKTVVSTVRDVLIGADLAASVKNLSDALNASTDSAVAVAQYDHAAGVLNVTYGDLGTEGNGFKLAVGTSGGTVSGATLTGGQDPTGKRVDVTDGVGINLLSTAKELRLHPLDRAEGDTRDDFVIPLAATAGGLKFAYKTEDVRVFSCEFTGYPDPETRRLFSVGN